MLTTVHASGGQDQMQARAMQRALWPATLGYWMDKMMTPVFGDDTVAATRWFFTSYVSGRGPVPAIRIGGQPYGILPDHRVLPDRLAPPAHPGGAGRGPMLAFLAQLLRGGHERRRRTGPR